MLFRSLAADSTQATGNIEKIIAELCKDIDETVSDIEKVKSSMMVSIEAADKVEKTFGSYKELAEETSRLANAIDTLIAEMYEIDNSVVHAAQRIRDVSCTTEELSGKVTVSLEEELGNIRNEVGRLMRISDELEQEMVKFKISG